MFTDSNFNQVKLIDFGESKKIEGSIDSMSNYIEQTNTDLVGTPLFVVPELAKAFKDRIVMFTTDNDGDGDTSQYEYDKSIDIWSFGIVNYYMLSKKYPWNVNNHVKGVEGRSMNCTELYDNIMKGDLGFSTFKTTRSDINEIETVVDFILKLCQESGPKLEGFFDEMLNIIPDNHTFSNRESAEKAIVGYCYLLAGLRNKFVNTFKLDLGLYLAENGTSAAAIETLSNADISASYKTIENYKKKK
nr:11952_t:CDS:2 [Entrophospora candida]